MSVARRTGKTTRRKRGAHKRSQQHWWHSRGFVLGLLVVTVLMGISVIRELASRVETQYEIQQLEGEVARLEDRNAQLGDLIALFNTSTVQDQQARTRLGVQAEGETVLQFPNRVSEKQIILPDSDTIEYIPTTNYQTNPEKWYTFFIGDERNT